MNKKYEKLFESYKLNNGVEIKNRLVVAPMTLFAANEDGTLGEGDFEFIRNRSKDIGMFIVEATLVSKSGKAFIYQPELTEEIHLKGMSKLAKMIQSEGSKAILQLHHGGKLAIIEDKIAPSADTETGAREMTGIEIENIIKDFNRATKMAIEAGFDGVEIHGANGYLLQQFYSAQSNKRADKWGGNRENRMNFIIEVIDAVISAKDEKKAKDFIIGYRFSPEESGEDGLTMEDTLVLVDKLVTKPLQYLHVSLHNFFGKVRRGADTSKNRIDLLHKKINGILPLIGVGSLFTADEILSAFETGWAEFIGLGQTAIVNPNIGTLIAEGKENTIRKSIYLKDKDKYAIPEYLWNLITSRIDWLKIEVEEQ